MRLCAEDGCLREVSARGLCESHYRAERHDEVYGVTEERVLEVARRHGTTVAAQWSGWSPERVVTLRKRVDGYDRGRGRPSRAEMEAAKPRLDCDCTRCLVWRSEQATAAGRRHGSVNQPTDAWAIDRVALGRLQRDGACTEHPLEWWFPTSPGGRGHALDWSRGRPICETCPVRTECLDYALEHRIPDGMFGGLTPHERRQLDRVEVAS